MCETVEMFDAKCDLCFYIQLAPTHGYRFIYHIYVSNFNRLLQATLDKCLFRTSVPLENVGVGNLNLTLLSVTL